MNLKIFHFLLIILMFMSCSQIVDNYIEHRQEENYQSPYKGVYTGTYSGIDSGTLRLEVSAKDNVTVTRISDKNQITETFNGAIVGNSLNGIKSQSSGFMLQGTLTPRQDGTYAGTWKINSDSGSWLLKKQ